jgi:hypothetical protein
MDIGGCRHQGVDQSGFGIDANVDLHPKVVLIPLLRLVHLRITRAAIVFCRTGRRDQRRINRRTAFEQESLDHNDCECMTVSESHTPPWSAPGVHRKKGSRVGPNNLATSVDSLNQLEF